MRQLNSIDRIITGLESKLGPTAKGDTGTGRELPASTTASDTALDPAEQHLSAALMRVNHAGEIAAQALYKGQAVAARSPEIRATLEESALEEQDHLLWCKQRVEELGESTSRLEPLWYWGSFSIGAVAGGSGDAWSMGFIKETEDQVIEHLKGHLNRLPASDTRSRSIVEQMIIDEKEHGDKAVQAGGKPLPAPVKSAMKMTARVMTALSFRF